MSESSTIKSDMGIYGYKDEVRRYLAEVNENGKVCFPMLGIFFTRMLIELHSDWNTAFSSLGFLLTTSDIPIPLQSISP